MRRCDTLLVVGSSFPYGEFYPKVGQAKAVQIDIDGRLLEPAISDGRELERRCQADTGRFNAADPAQERSGLAETDHRET